jgi:SAM-dependent methyltransferase
MNDQAIREHLRRQYDSERNLQIRIQTHQKYSAPQVDFTKWILDQIDWRNVDTVIDAGCGNGNYAAAVQERGRRYIAGDLSFGMLSSLAGSILNRVNLDIHRLPFADSAADVILANHMLYYVNLRQVPAELYRVLRPGGRLIAATNSRRTMAELTWLQERALERIGRPGLDLPRREALPFTLENGAAYLNRHFDKVTRQDLPSALVFRDPKPLIDYISTMSEHFSELFGRGVTWSQFAAAMHQELSEYIQEHGEFRVSKLTGVFVCQKR